MPERDLDIFSFSAPSTDERTPLQPRPNSPILLRRDSEFSVGSEYDDGSPNNLNAWQGSALLTAECMGTGMLALPADVSVLGYGLGLGFLILNLPINLYAGTVFSHTAAAIETRQSVENRLYQGYIAGQPDDNLDYRVVNASTVDSELTADAEVVDYRAVNNDTAKSFVSILTTGTTHTRLHHDTATMDFIGMADALFRRRRSTRLVMIIYYVNLFLVLGNYILVMSHAVSAVFGERICLPAAGLVASTGMFVVSQSRTMARLGRTAAILSLVAIFIVVIQCIWAVQYGPIQAHKTVVAESSLLRKMSSIGGIGFAVGGQKLLLNVRHELSNRSAAPKSLAGALAFYGTFYVIICLLAGPNPPSFLFDAIQPGWNRQLAGLLLWGHVGKFVSASIIILPSLNRDNSCQLRHQLASHLQQRRPTRLASLTSATLVESGLAVDERDGCGGRCLVHGCQCRTVFQGLGVIDWSCHLGAIDFAAAGDLLEEAFGCSSLETNSRCGLFLCAGGLCDGFHGCGNNWIGLLDSTRLVEPWSAFRLSLSEYHRWRTSYNRK